MALDLTGGPKGLEVATTKLTGIVRGANTTLALVEAQDGIGYILKPGDTLGDGRLVEIGIDTVVFTVASRSGAQSNRVVLRLAAN
jgi:Tfp pilus assembly protein PilP